MSDQGVVEAHMELGCDPSGEWEDEGDCGLDLNADLKNMPNSSQDSGHSKCHVEWKKQKVNVLHELDGEEVTDTECDNFLEETFVLPPESGEVEDNIFEIIDVACDRPHKSEELSDEVMSFITNTKKK